MQDSLDSFRVESISFLAYIHMDLEINIKKRKVKKVNLFTSSWKVFSNWII